MCVQAGKVQVQKWHEMFTQAQAEAERNGATRLALQKDDKPALILSAQPSEGESLPWAILGGIVLRRWVRLI